MGPIPKFTRPNFFGNSICSKYRLVGCPDRRSGMHGSSSTVITHMEPPTSRKQAKRVPLGPKRPLLGAPDVLGEPRGADLVPTTPDWPAWVGFMVTTHFDLVMGPFHSPILSGYIVYQPLLTCTILICAPANYRVVHLVILMVAIFRLRQLCSPNVQRPTVLPPLWDHRDSVYALRPR